jgi:hypothetical protein
MDLLQHLNTHIQSEHGIVVSLIFLPTVNNIALTHAILFFTVLGT